MRDQLRTRIQQLWNSFGDILVFTIKFTAVLVAHISITGYAYEQFDIGVSVIYWWTLFSAFFIGGWIQRWSPKYTVTENY